MAEHVELINSIRENFRDDKDRKFKNSLRETLERFVNGQDVFLRQLTGLRKFESFGSGTSNNKVNKETDQPLSSLS